jgi:hypothetical protein
MWRFRCAWTLYSRRVHPNHDGKLLCNWRTDWTWPYATGQRRRRGRVTGVHVHVQVVNPLNFHKTTEKYLRLPLRTCMATPLRRTNISDVRVWPRVDSTKGRNVISPFIPVSYTIIVTHFTMHPLRLRPLNSTSPYHACGIWPHPPVLWPNRREMIQCAVGHYVQGQGGHRSFLSLVTMAWIILCARFDVNAHSYWRLVFGAVHLNGGWTV